MTDSVHAIARALQALGDAPEYMPEFDAIYEKAKRTGVLPAVVFRLASHRSSPLAPPVIDQSHSSGQSASESLTSSISGSTPAISDTRHDSPISTLFFSQTTSLTFQQANKVSQQGKAMYEETPKWSFKISDLMKRFIGHAPHAALDRRLWILLYSGP